MLCNALNADDLLDDDDDEDEENLHHSNSSMFSQDNSIADDGRSTILSTFLINHIAVHVQLSPYVAAFLSVRVIGLTQLVTLNNWC